MFRFIHTADIHLDSPLKGLSDYPNAPVNQLRGASRQAFSELVSRAIEERVDFMVIAGDLYDGAWRDHNTGIFFCQEMGRLKRAGIPVYLKFGNHDAESEMTRKLELPDNVHCFSARKPESFLIPGILVALHGQSFKDKETMQNLVANYPDPVPDHYNIGVLHTALEGHVAHPSYAPCSVAELQARGYQYWALGHVHEFRVWEGNALIVFPGNLQGRSIRETGQRGAVLVTVDDEGHTSMERLFIDVLRWEAIEVGAADCQTLAEVSRKIGASLEALLEVDEHVPRAVRVTVTGRTPAHGELFGLESQLRAEVLGHIAAIGNERLWLEKVRLETALPALPAGTFQQDALADLEAIFQEAGSDAEFMAALREDLQGLASKAPLDLFSLVPALDAIRAGEVAPLLEGVAPGLLARLAEER